MSSQPHPPRPPQRTRREFLRQASVATAVAAAAPGALAQTNTAAPPAAGQTILDFERELKRERFELYRHPPTDILKRGFRPVGGSVADFATARHEGRDHFFYIERRLQEGTPFFPGHEIYFGHASTVDFFAWEVHEPVMLIRPGTWEEAHVWAPVILRDGERFIMAYTGLNRHLSQNIGLASSRDLFDWQRWEANPISPCQGARWAAWWDNDIASCRDPDLLRHEGRVWMPYTANTKTGATCIALASTADFKTWQDHGPILVGPASGYECHLWGGHPQGSFESANLSFRHGRWVLVFQAAIRGGGSGTWAVASDRIDSFQAEKRWRFWEDGACVEVVRNQGDRSLLAGLYNGCLRFGEVNWADPQPAVKTVTDHETLQQWHSV
jgi:hypothetical protein